MRAVAVAVATTSPCASARLPSRNAIVPPRCTHATGADQPPGRRRTQEADLQLQGGGELVGFQSGGQGRAERVVEHRRQKAALDDADRVEKLLTCFEGDANRAQLLVDLLQCPAKGLGRGRRLDPASNSVPERAGALAAQLITHTHA